MNEKKVVAVIVEGPSDENAIGSILKEFFSSEEVQFAVVHGDITSDYATTKENVVSKVGALIEKIKSKYGYEWEHFIKIIHIADTDGALKIVLNRQKLKRFNIMRATWNILMLMKLRKEMNINQKLCLNCIQLGKFIIFSTDYISIRVI